MHKIKLNIFIIFLIFSISDCGVQSERYPGRLQNEIEYYKARPIAGYFLNRLMDFRDIVRFSVPMGLDAGAKIQISKFALGLYGSAGYYGHGIALAVDYGLIEGEFCHRSREVFIFVFGEDTSDNSNEGFCNDRMVVRKKNRSIEYGRIGFTVSLFIGITLEINIVEIADLIIGFFQVDIVSDDIY